MELALAPYAYDNADVRELLRRLRAGTASPEEVLHDFERLFVLRPPPENPLNPDMAPRRPLSRSADPLRAAMEDYALAHAEERALVAAISALLDALEGEDPDRERIEWQFRQLRKRGVGAGGGGSAYERGFRDVYFRQRK